MFVCSVFTGTHGTVLGNNFSLGVACDLLAFTLCYSYSVDDCLRNVAESLLPKWILSSQELEGGGRIEPWLLSDSVHCSSVPWIREYRAQGHQLGLSHFWNSPSTQTPGLGHFGDCFQGEWVFASPHRHQSQRLRKAKKEIEYLDTGVRILH